ncbi:fimbrial protein [Escherichia coli]
MIYFDFDTIPASEFSSTAGQAITSRKITKTVSIECTGMGMSVRRKSMLLLQGRTEAVTIRWLRQTMPMSGSKFTINRMLKLASTTASYPQTWATLRFFGRNGSVTFSAAPASFTGARPQPGVFNATATLTIEFVN